MPGERAFIQIFGNDFILFGRIKRDLAAAEPVFRILDQLVERNDNVRAG